MADAQPQCQPVRDYDELPQLSTQSALLVPGPNRGEQGTIQFPWLVGAMTQAPTVRSISVGGHRVHRSYPREGFLGAQPGE